MRIAFITAGAAGMFCGSCMRDNTLVAALGKLSEALEEHRDHRKPDEVWYSLKSAKMEAAAREELGLGPDDPLPRGVNCSIPVPKGTPGAKPEGIPSEIADVVIRCAHYCGANGIDLAAIVSEKAAFNKSRPHKHGGRAL